MVAALKSPFRPTAKLGRDPSVEVSRLQREIDIAFRRVADHINTCCAESLVAVAEAEARLVPKERTITAGNGLTGAGDLSADRIISVDASVVQLSSEKGAADGYAALDTNSRLVSAAQVLYEAGGTSLSAGTVLDGYLIGRSGTSYVGIDPSTLGKAGTGTDNHLVRWDGTTALQDSGVVVSDGSDDVTMTVGDGTGSTAVVIQKTAATDTAELVLGIGSTQATGSVRFHLSTSAVLTLGYATSAASYNTRASFSNGGRRWTWSGAQVVPSVTTHTLTGAATSLTIDWDVGNVKHVNLNAAGASVALTLNNPQHGARYEILLVLTDNNETHAVTWPSSVMWANTTFDPGTAPPTLDTTADQTVAYLLVEFVYDNTLGVYFGKWSAFADA